MNEVQGLEQIEENIEKIAQQMEPDVVENILLSKAEMIRERASTAAPQDETGNLKRGIVAKVLQRRGDKYAPAMAGINYGIAPHAHLVEFGHAIRFSRKGKSFGFVPPHPFFRPVFDSEKDVIKLEIAEEIKANIEGAPTP
jgi:HK97 gp10 family phage protein